eukprot:SAG31_NODE_5150_length_2713_cov_2.298776_2_plen_136_part_00
MLFGGKDVEAVVCECDCAPERARGVTGAVLRLPELCQLRICHVRGCFIAFAEQRIEVLQLGSNRCHQGCVAGYQLFSGQQAPRLAVAHKSLGAWTAPVAAGEVCAGGAPVTGTLLALVNVNTPAVSTVLCIPDSR